MEDNCIFCKVASGEIPHDRVYENENFVAFLDINPVVDGHLLVIPKEHVVWMQDASDEMISEIFKVVKKMMQALKKTFNADYVMTSVVGKDVPHFHVHLIPRFFNDKFSGWPTKKYREGESEKLVAKITAVL